MKAIHKKSLAVCVGLLMCFAAMGAYMKLPEIKEFLSSLQSDSLFYNSTTSVDPFRKEELLPPVVKELNPSYTIKASLLPDQATIAGTVTMTFDNPQTEKLYLYYYGYKWSSNKISAIRWKGKSMSYNRRDPVLVLDNPAKNETRTQLEVVFETKVPRGPTRFGVHQGIWTLTHWYPMLGAMDQQKRWYEPPQVIGYGDPYIYHYADYEVDMVAPSSFNWVTSWGRGKKFSNEGGRSTYHFTGKKLLNFTMVGSPLYKVETVKISPNLTVDIGSTDVTRLAKLKEIATQVLPIYSKLMGELPYPRIGIAETGDDTVYAMEYANMAIIAKHKVNSNQVEHWLPHELAHLWWYNSVENIEPYTGWMDEGLVEASVTFYYRERYGEKAAAKILAEYQAEANRLAKAYPYGKLSNHLTQFKDYYEFDWTWYSNAALLFDNLRKQLGDQLFFDFLKRVQSNYQHKVIGPEHLDQALGQILEAEAQYFVPNVHKQNQKSFIPIAAEYYVNIIIGQTHFYPVTRGRIRNQVVYLPLRETLEQLGFKVISDQANRTIRAESKRNVIVFHEKSDRYVLNGVEQKMPVPLLEWHARSLFPLALLNEGLGYRVTYQKEKRTVTIQ
ncbi:stalk domain-containing protein [Brevibacillus halotolerans]|uniref:stalk domain-containing protein n=1 Tax=Brevibacillus laterosporus TaxID=1465 RepID=UPI00215C0A34|nr:stalk domain-containing protein [Brevibacillus laterosporus]MCR8995007.1 stalk domain-containing protein [Brevibacillus laterosporus]WPS89407.1 stalk domain-containing protein [Brevibacillus halotolerans]